MSGPVDDRLRVDFDRIDEMVRRSCNLRWRHLVSVDDVVATQETEILAIAMDQVVEDEMARVTNDALAEWIGGDAA